MRRLAPVILLFFLSPAVGELLSGSAPPVEYFQPIGFIVIHLLYGCGAILVRELTVRWQKGWLTMFVLGAVYGILEEGLTIKSFFDPNWMNLGILNSYERWGGVNWVWCVEFTLYHAIISIRIPIIPVGLVFPDRGHELWLGCQGLVILSSLLAIDVLFGLFFLTPYKPPAAPYLLSIVAMVVLVFLARNLPQ